MFGTASTMRSRHKVFSVGFFAIDVRVLDVRLLLRSLLPDAITQNLLITLPLKSIAQIGQSHRFVI